MFKTKTENRIDKVKAIINNLDIKKKEYNNELLKLHKQLIKEKSMALKQRRKDRVKLENNIKITRESLPLLNTFFGNVSLPKGKGWSYI